MKTGQRTIPKNEDRERMIPLPASLRVVLALVNRPPAGWTYGPQVPPEQLLGAGRQIGLV